MHLKHRVIGAVSDVRTYLFMIANCKDIDQLYLVEFKIKKSLEKEMILNGTQMVWV